MRQSAAQRVATRKANGNCIDCGQPAPESRTAYKVRCGKCSGSVAKARRTAIQNGLCGVCRKAPRRDQRTTCSDCAAKVSRNRSACNPSGNVVGSTT